MGMFGSLGGIVAAVNPVAAIGTGLAVGGQIAGYESTRQNASEIRGAGEAQANAMIESAKIQAQSAKDTAAQLIQAAKDATKVATDAATEAQRLSQIASQTNRAEDIAAAQAAEQKANAAAQSAAQTSTQAATAAATYSNQAAKDAEDKANTAAQTNRQEDIQAASEAARLSENALFTANGVAENAIKFGADQSNAEFSTALTSIRKNLEPYMTQGTAANKRLSDLAGLNGPEAAKNALTMDPGYQFRVDQGKQAIERSAAAGANPGLFSGNTGIALQKYGQDSASDEFMNAFNRLQSLSSSGLAATNTMGGYDWQNAGVRSQNAQNVAGTQAQNALNMGNLQGQNAWKVGATTQQGNNLVANTAIQGAQNTGTVGGQNAWNVANNAGTNAWNVANTAGQGANNTGSATIGANDRYGNAMNQGYWNVAGAQTQGAQNLQNATNQGANLNLNAAVNQANAGSQAVNTQTGANLNASILQNNFLPQALTQLSNQAFSLYGMSQGMPTGGGGASNYTPPKPTNAMNTLPPPSGNLYGGYNP